MTVMETCRWARSAGDPTRFLHDDLDRVLKLLLRLSASDCRSAAARSPAENSRCWRSRAR